MIAPMAICPLCEHVQEGGWECAVCGKRFADGGEPAQPVERLEELVPTRLEATAPPTLEQMSDLEPTFHAAAAVAGEEAPPWIEPTSLPAEQLSRDLLALPACRSCRMPAAPGDVFCARCGLKLPVPSRPPQTPAPRLRRCRSCGLVGAGDACPGCGARLPAEE